MKTSLLALTVLLASNAFSAEQPRCVSVVYEKGVASTNPNDQVCENPNRTVVFVPAQAGSPFTVERALKAARVSYQLLSMEGGARYVVSGKVSNKLTSKLKASAAEVVIKPGYIYRDGTEQYDYGNAGCVYRDVPTAAELQATIQFKSISITALEGKWVSYSGSDAFSLMKDLATSPNAEQCYISWIRMMPRASQ